MAKIPGLGEYGLANARVSPTQTMSAGQVDGGLASAGAHLAGTLGAAAGQLATQAASEQRDEALRQEHIAKQAADRAETTQHLVTHATIQTGLADLGDQLQRGVQSGEITKDDARKTFRESSQKIIDTNATNLPQWMQERVRAESIQYTGAVGNKLEDVIVKQDQRNVDANLLTYREQMQRLATSDMPTAITQWTRTVDAMGAGAGWTPEKIATEKQKFKEGVQYTAAGAFLTAARDDPKQLSAFEDYVSKNLPDMDPQKKQELMDRAVSRRLAYDQRMELQAARAERQAEAHLKRAEAAYNVFQTVAAKGTSLDPAYLDQVAAQTRGTPYADGVVKLAQQAKETGGVAAQPLPKQRAMLDQLNQQINANGASPALLKQREMIENVTRATEQDYKDGGLRAAQERGVVPAIAPLDLSGGLPGIAKALGERIQQAQVAGVHRGKPVSPLLPEEADKVVSTIKALPEQERAESLAMLTRAMPKEQAGALAEQLDAKDRTLSLAMKSAASQAYTTNGRYAATLIFKGAQAMKDRAVKEDNAALSGVRAQIASEVGDSLTGQARQDAVDSGVLMYYGKQAEGQGVNAREAVSLAVNGSVVEHNGRKVHLPVGVDESALTKQLGNVTPDTLASQAPGGVVRAGGVEMPLAEFTKSLPGQQLMAVKPGQFSVIVGGRPVVNAKGQAVLIGVK